MGSFHKAICDVSDQLDHFFDKYYASVNMCGPQIDSAKYQQNPLMFACTHRSHIDYILVGYELHKKGFKEIRFAAGDNLTGLPYVGARFKSFGAFSVSRDVGFDRNYVRKLSESVVSMLDRGEPVIVFPEGGRSYSGAMLELRNGVLGASVLSQAKDLSRDAFVMPIAASYELIPDLPFFDLLLKGKQYKKKDNNLFKRFMGSVYYFGADILAYLPLFMGKNVKENFGNAYIDYKTPVSIRSIVDIEKNRVENARDEFSAHRVSMQMVNSYLYKEFISLYRILPVHIISSIIKNGQDSVASVKSKIPEVVDQLVKNGRNTVLVEKMQASEIIEQGFYSLNRLGAVVIANDSIEIKKKVITEYYSATI